MYKLDLKDLFMDGEHCHISDSCVAVVQEALDYGMALPGINSDCVFDVSVFRQVLEVLLQNQFVDASITNVLFKVIRGSGMGHKHSASVSSSNLYYLAERHLCSPDVLSSRGIAVFVRYHDDIFFIARSARQGRDFYLEYKRLASLCYTVELDDVSMYGVQMLDIFIYKGERFQSNWRIDWRPFIKKTSRSVPSISCSMHSNQIHRSWPVAEICRM